MKLNRKWLLVTALVLSLTMATAGTLAYLTDRDTVENTFTMGNVDIEVDETFEPDSPLNPGVEVEKQAGITNTHNTSDAWVWMTVSVPEDLVDYLELGWLDSAEVEELDAPVHEGYVSYLVKHPEILEPGDTTPMYLQSVTLSETVDFQNGEYVGIEDGTVVSLGDLSDVTVIVDGFAMQTNGFDTVDDAYTAYASQWGGMNGGDSGAEGGPEKEPISIDTAEELADALAATNNILLDASVESTSYDVAEKAKVNLDLQGNTVGGAINNFGTLNVSGGTMTSHIDGLDNSGTATVTDVTMNAGSTADYAAINRAGSTATYENFNLTSAGGGVAAADGAQVTFKSGSVAVNSASTSGRYLFYAVGEGTVITIEDGTFSFSSTLNQKRAYIYADAGTTVYVKGGTFGPASTRSGYTAGIMGSGKVEITGGTFGFDPSAWVPAGYTAVKSGSTWTVSAQ